MDETIIFEGKKSWRSIYHIFAAAFTCSFGTILGYVSVKMIRSALNSSDHILLGLLIFVPVLIVAVVVLFGTGIHVWHIARGRVDRQILFRGGLQMAFGERVYKARWKDIGAVIAWRAPWASGYSIYIQFYKYPWRNSGGSNSNPPFLLDRTFTYDQMAELFQKIQDQAIAPPDCKFYESLFDKLFSYVRGR